MNETRQKQLDEVFCRSCGEVIKKEAVICPKCGVPQTGSSSLSSDWLVLLLLCFFLGYLGVHRFYAGKIGTGLLMLFTIGGFGIWVLVDLLLILTEKFTDSKGDRVLRNGF